MNRDGIPDVLQQQAVGAPVSYAAPVQYAAPAPAVYAAPAPAYAVPQLPPTTVQAPPEQLVKLDPLPAIYSPAAVPVAEMSAPLDNGRVPTTATQTIQAPAVMAPPAATEPVYLAPIREYLAPAPAIYTEGEAVMAVAPAPAVYMAPAPAVQTVAPAPAVSYAAPAPAVQMMAPAPAVYAAPAPATMTITGVDMNRDGIPDVLQQPAAAVSYAAP